MTLPRSLAIPKNWKTFNFASFFSAIGYPVLGVALFVTMVLLGIFISHLTFHWWYMLIAFAVIWGYYIYFEVRWNGQSPGKRRIGIRVLRRDGTPVSATESAVRNLVRVIDFLPFAYGVGVVTMFVHEQACRLGDLAASTLVVHERSEITLESLRQSTSMPLMTTPFEESVRSWPLTRLDADDLQLAAEFLQRRYTLVNAPALARAILARMIAKMGVVDESYRQYEPAFVIATIMRSHPG